MPNRPDIAPLEEGMQKAGSTPEVFDPNLAYLHDGSIEGFFSAVFESYARHELPAQIAAEIGFQQSLGQVCVPIPTNEMHALRVKKGLINKLGDRGFTKVFRGFLSDDPEKDTKLYRYILYGMRVGRRVLHDITHEDVSPVEDLATNVGREVRYMLMFTRFSLVEGGIYFAKINPTSNVLPMIMDHFASRFNIQPFLIYDEIHHVAGIYDTKTWYLASADDLHLPAQVETDADYQHLWKTFFDTIAIEERKNYACQRNFMPKRFWRNLTEMSLLDEMGVQKGSNENSAESSDKTPKLGHNKQRTQLPEHT